LKKGNVFYKGENEARQYAGGVFHSSLHAEMNALFKYIKVGERKKRFRRPEKRGSGTVYVIRLMNYDKNGETIMGCSRPCEHCQKWLKIYNVKKVFYTDFIDGENVLCEARLCEARLCEARLRLK
jgi:deoxycytidylate deaminase